MTIADRIRKLFEANGCNVYFGEYVTQQEHALQTAYLADQEGTSDSLIVAALLHDIGHLLHSEDETVADKGVDMRHEKLGCDWLGLHFGPDVTEPVRLHVAAKRYLCATDAAYHGSLSPASVKSLALQGGPFTAEEKRDFERLPHYTDAVRLRRWDDEAKIVGLSVPGLERYMARVAATARNGETA